MSLKDRIRKIVYHEIADLIMVLIIIFSTLFLIIELAFNFTPGVRNILDRIDLFILCIFLLEFLTKLFLDGGKYFIKNYGWIDLLATIPILLPVTNFIVLQLSAAFIINKGTVDILQTFRVVRIIRIIRVVRILRIVRLLKLIHHIEKKNAPSGEYTGPSLNIPAVTILIVVLISYSAILFQETTIVSKETANTKILLNTLTSDNIEQVFKMNQNFILLLTGIDKDLAIKRKMSDEDIRKNFRKDEILSVYMDSGAVALVSIKPQISLLRVQELFLIANIVILLCSYILYANKIRSKIAGVAK